MATGGVVAVGRIDRSLEFIEHVKAAQTPEEVCRGLLTLTADFGLTSLVAGTLATGTASSSRDTNRVVLCNWPRTWSDTFIAADFRADDPVAAEIAELQARIRNLGWTMPAQGNGSAALPADLHVRDVVSFSLVAPDGSLVEALLGGDRGYSASDLRRILLVSTYAIGRAIQLVGNSATAARHARLTAREIECLRWASRGKSEWEIGTILGISEHTSEKHLISARSKLSAANRVQAVAEAIRRGYI